MTRIGPVEKSLFDCTHLGPSITPPEISSHGETCSAPHVRPVGALGYETTDHFASNGAGQLQCEQEPVTGTATVVTTTGSSLPTSMLGETETAGQLWFGGHDATFGVASAVAGNITTTTAERSNQCTSNSRSSSLPLFGQASPLAKPADFLRRTCRRGDRLASGLAQAYPSEMARRIAAMLVPIVSLTFAAVSLAGVQSFSIGQGPITLLTPSELTVQANAEIPTSCMRASSSPAIAGFKIGDRVTINCVQGVLVSISGKLGSPPLGPVTPIPGLRESPGGVPVPGPSPSANQCKAAWNATAPLVSRQAIAAQDPLAAYVGSSTADLGASTRSSQDVAGPTCSIWFALPGVRTTWVTSVWKDGTARDWRGFGQRGYMGPTRGILSQATVKAIATASTPGTSVLGSGIQASHWFWVSPNGTLRNAD